MGNRLIVAISLGLALATAAACGDDDETKTDSSVKDGGPVVDRDSSMPGIDSGMDAQTPGADGTVPRDGNVVTNPDGSGGGDTSTPPQPGSSTKTISSAGGSITSADGNLTITFPLGALQRPIDVTIRQVTTDLPMGVRGGVYYAVTPVWESFTSGDQRVVTASLKYNAAILAGGSANDLQFGRFEGGGWVKLTNAQPVKDAQNVEWIRGELTKLGTLGFFTGVCEACAEPTCVAETCKVGEAMVPGKCVSVNGCSVCRPTCDDDGDGYCRQDQGGGIRGGDCDVANPDINPGATELCNGIDDNCSGLVDEGCKACKLDSDCPEDLSCQSGFCRTCSTSCTPGVACSINSGTSTFVGRCAMRGRSCSECVPSCDDDGDTFCEMGSPPSGQDTNAFDCADDKFDINPRVVESCGDGLDNDCDGKADNNCQACEADATCPGGTYCSGKSCLACTTTCAPETCTTGRCADYGNGCKRCAPPCDSDGDGYCVQQDGDFPGGDCNDGDATVSPGSIEICGNGKNDDCDNFTDENCKACTTDNDCENKQACVNGGCVTCDGSFDPTQIFGGSDTNPDAGVRAVQLNYGKNCTKGIPACDTDKDGFCTIRPGDPILGGDCAGDMDPNINSAHIEVCGNEKDDDCDGQVDENCQICTESAMCGASRHCTSGT